MNNDCSTASVSNQETGDVQNSTQMNDQNIATADVSQQQSPPAVIVDEKDSNNTCVLKNRSESKEESCSLPEKAEENKEIATLNIKKEGELIDMSTEGNTNQDDDDDDLMKKVEDQVQQTIEKEILRTTEDDEEVDDDEQQHQALCDKENTKSDNQTTENNKSTIAVGGPTKRTETSVRTSNSATVITDETQEVSSTRNDDVAPQKPVRSSSGRRPSYNSGRGYASGGYQNYGLTYLPYKSNFEPSEEARRRADEFFKTLKL